MGFPDAREPSKNAIFHGDGFLLHHMVLISVKVTYPPICKEMESSCNDRYTPNALHTSVASMREKRACLFGRRWEIAPADYGLWIFFGYTLLEGIIDFWEAVPTQCSLEGRKGLGFLCRFRSGHAKGWNFFLSADPRTVIMPWQFS